VSFKFKQKISEEIFNRKYCLHGETTPEEVFKGVAKEISLAEKTPEKQKKWEEKFYDAIVNGYFIPGGRILANARPNSPMKNYNNCFTIDIEDSMNGITNSIKEYMTIQSVGGGVGFNVSKLRPSGSPISKGGESSGPLSFLEVFDAASKQIRVGGQRRAASIAILNDTHPDVIDFITAKKGNENNTLTQFNISVGITDKFMKAVENDEDWEFEFNGKKTERIIKAREMYNILSKNAWWYNEPGALFLDTIEKYNNGHHAFRVDRCNPCVVGGTLVAVADGRVSVPFKQLVEEGKDVPVFAKDKNGKTIVRVMRNPRITGYNKEIYEITLDDGSIIKCTSNHKIFTKDKSFVRADELKIGDSLWIDTKWKTSYKEMFGGEKEKTEYWFYNDGHKNRAEHRIIFEELNGEITKRNVIHHKNFDSLDNSISNLSSLSKEEHDSLHSRLMIGENNPYHKMSDEWKRNFATHKGADNGRYVDFSITDLIIKLKTWAEENKSIITWKDYENVCIENNIPPYFKNRNTTAKNIIESINIENGYKIYNKPQEAREYNRYLNLLKESDLDLYFIDGCIYAEKICENCGKTFKVKYYKREQSYCSSKCGVEFTSKERKEKSSKTLKDRMNSKKETFIISFIKFVSENKKIPIGEDLNNLLITSHMKDFRTVREKSYQRFLNREILNRFGVEISTKKLKNEEYSINKAEELIKNGLVYNHKVVSIRIIGKEDVYNGTVDEVHNYNTIVSNTETKTGNTKLVMVNNANCGEIVMPPYSLCCLGSINLSTLIKNAFTDKALFDYTKFSEMVSIGVRFLDNVLDRASYPLEKIEIVSKAWRRIGLGITGLGDALLKLGIKYGSKESIDFVEKVGKNLAENSYITSAYLAKEKGSFPAFDENIGKYGFITTLSEQTQKEIQDYGLRNIGLNTIAPTGTVSFSIGQNCSSGIEPIFSLQYDRTIIQDNDTKKDETIYDNGYLDYCDFFGNDKPLHDYVVTSHDIPIKASIDVQAAFQKYIDHSISKTINIPYETTLEEYKDIFMYAWKKGLKGVTSFHEGAGMEGILSTGKKKIKNTNKKRPEILECDIHEMQVDKERIIALVGLDDETDEPYELFITEDPDQIINVKHAKKGRIIRREVSGVNLYDLHIEGKRSEFILKDLASMFDDEWGTLGRMTSLALKNGVPMQDIVKQWNKAPKFGTFMKAVGRVLKKYIKDGEKAIGATCPECGSDNLEFREGCLTCLSCGNSKCG